MWAPQFFAICGRGTCTKISRNYIPNPNFFGIDDTFQLTFLLLLKKREKVKLRKLELLESVGTKEIRSPFQKLFQKQDFLLPKMKMFVPQWVCKNPFFILGSWEPYGCIK